MEQLFMIAFGGALGAMTRYSITLGIHQILGRAFPYGTLMVNVLGGLLIGLLSVLLLERLMVSVVMRMFLLTGFLGAMTTFSTFSVETINLLEQGQWLTGTINVLANVSLSLLATVLGMFIAKVYL